MMPDVHDRANDHPAASVLLLILGWFLNILSDLSLSDFYAWVFKTLSLMSLILIVLINWRKGIEELKAIFKKK